MRSDIKVGSPVEWHERDGTRRVGDVVHVVEPMTKPPPDLWPSGGVRRHVSYITRLEAVQSAAPEYRWPRGVSLLVGQSPRSSHYQCAVCGWALDFSDVTAPIELMRCTKCSGQVVIGPKADDDRTLGKRWEDKAWALSMAIPNGPIDDRYKDQIRRLRIELYQAASGF